MLPRVYRVGELFDCVEKLRVEDTISWKPESIFRSVWQQVIHLPKLLNFHEVHQELDK